MFSGAYPGTSRLGGADFQKYFENFVDLFLGRPHSFSELSQSIKKTLFWSKFQRHKQSFEKQGKKGVFRHFFENIDQKIAFFRRALPSQN